jgi:diguanylate cyclase (GGDEF)-like protein/PAS domain S-box-containing protein
LKKPDEHLENIINAIGDGVFVKDRQHRWVFMNDAILKAIGYEREELIGKSDYDFFPKEEADVFWKKDEQVFQTGIENLNEEAITDAKGNRHIILTKKNLYEDSDGNRFIVGIIRDITESKKMEEKLKKTLKKIKSLSLSDDLTRLNNRRGFIALAQQQLKLANRKRTSLMLLFADLDGMKNINDKFGHPEGDRALKAVARILKSTFRESDIIARIGGDEFVVLAIEASKPGVPLVKHLKEKLKSHNKRSKKEYDLSLSMGLAGYSPRSPCTIEELLEKADRIMYQKKRKRKKQ